MILILYKIGENVLVMLHIYGAIAIFIIFYYHQDTESESQEMEIGIAVPIITQNIYISKYLWEKNIHTLKYGRKMWYSSYLWSYSHFPTIC